MKSKIIKARELKEGDTFIFLENDEAWEKQRVVKENQHILFDPPLSSPRDRNRITTTDDPIFTVLSGQMVRRYEKA
jgi:hypothetical protein